MYTEILFKRCKRIKQNHSIIIITVSRTKINKMAAVPSTIIVSTEDYINIPPKSLLIVMKQLFQYGVKDIVLNKDKVFISLSYCPRKVILQKKFGNLPIKYMRTKLNNKHEIEIFEKMTKLFSFNLDVPEALDDAEGKEKLSIEPPSQSSTAEILLIDDDTPGPSKKRKTQPKQIIDDATADFEIFSQDFL